MKYYFFLLLLIPISLTSALDTSQYDFTYTPTTNYSLVNVNDSEYWDGNAWSDTRWLNINGNNANANISITPYRLTTGDIYIQGTGGTGDGLNINEDVGTQSVIWFRNNGIAKSSIFFTNNTNTFDWGTYTSAGAWNGYGMRINQTDKHISFFGNISSPNGNLSINEITSKKITETITTNNYGLKINRSVALSPTDSGVPIVNITNIIPAGSIGINTFDGLLIDTYYSGVAQVGYNALHSKLNMSSQITGGNNILGETTMGQDLAGNGIIGIINADRQTSTNSGLTVAVEGSTKGNRSGDLYGAYTKAQNTWTGKSYGYYGYGQANTGNATGVFGFAQSTSGFAVGVYGQPFSSNINSFSYQGLGHNHYSGGVTYFYSSQALQQAQNTTNFKFSDFGSVYINKYLEVDNITFLNGGLNMTLQNITNIRYACFDESCSVYLRYNGTCIISSNDAGGSCI